MWVSGKMGRTSGVRWTALIDIAKFFLLMGAMIWLALRGASQMGYNWQWYRVPRYFFTVHDGVVVIGPLIRGLMVTFAITGVSLVLSFLIGMLTALFRLSGSITARLLARGYLELIRNTPLLVQIFFIYFALAPILDLGRFPSAVLALSLFEGAYASEIIRSGIVSLPQGQWEAAYSLGLSPYSTYRFVVLPQALRRVLPPLTGQAISLIKDSALVSTIALFDLTMAGQRIVSETFLTFEIWFTVAAIYLSVTLTLSLLAGFLERKLKVRT